MRLSSLATKSLIEYIMEILEDNHYQNGYYDVIDAFPTDFNKVNIFPTISIERINISPKSEEIGANDRKQLIFSIDIFGNGQNQKDDLSDLMFDNLNKKYISIYDFNEGFPSVVGDYGAITKLGEMYVKEYTSHSLVPSQYDTIEQKKFHEMINIVTILQNITL